MTSFHATLCQSDTVETITESFIADSLLIEQSGPFQLTHSLQWVFGNILGTISFFAQPSNPISKTEAPANENENKPIAATIGL